jgi:DNA-binding transcriptional regulator YhcF (GntR family)
VNRPSDTSGEASANGALGGRRTVRVDPHSLVPPSQQLVAAVLDAIARGDLGPGDKLPSVRGLAAEALVNPNTVGKAFRDLEHLGATEGRNGSGVFVTAAGPDVARAIRLAETLATFREAALAAVRAGHDGSVLQAALGAAQAEEGKAKGAGNGEDAALAARSRR